MVTERSLTLGGETNKNNNEKEKIILKKEMKAEVSGPRS